MKKILRKIFNYMQEISPIFSLRVLYFMTTKKVKLNLSDPETFDEKIQWLKFYWQDPLIVKCGDKYTVRKYIKDKGLKEILPRIYGSYDSPDEMDYNEYPSKYVIKTSNACKTVIIVNDANYINKKKIKTQLETWQNLDYSKTSIEPHYKYMFPKIIVEEFLEDGVGLFPTDYKFFCFNGKPKFVEVMTNRDENHNIERHFYDLNWQPLNYTGTEQNLVLKKPKLFDEMIRISEILSEDFPFVRVDLYEIKDQIIFGELTFTPSSGMATYFTKDAQQEVGNMLELPRHKKVGFK